MKKFLKNKLVKCHPSNWKYSKLIRSSIGGPILLVINGEIINFFVNVNPKKWLPEISVLWSYESLSLDFILLLIGIKMMVTDSKKSNKNNVLIQIAKKFWPTVVILASMWFISCCDVPTYIIFFLTIVLYFLPIIQMYILDDYLKVAGNKLKNELISLNGYLAHHEKLQPAIITSIIGLFGVLITAIIR
jgi:hypothetical protein